MHQPDRGTTSRIVTAADPRDVAGDFAHRVAIDVRFADTDAMGHVNNAVYLTYCEMARIRYWSDVTGEPLAAGHHGSESLILAEARITYRAQVFHTDVVTVETRARHIGSSSFLLEHRLTACEPDGDPRLVAVSESVMVRFDYRVGRPARLDDRFVEAMETFEGRVLRDT
jgi:acyl-CoA thioester hydrolase